MRKKQLDSEADMTFFQSLQILKPGEITELVSPSTTTIDNMELIRI